MYNLAVETEADLHVNSWNVEDCGLQVIGFGLQSGGAFLSSKKMSGGGVGGLELLLFGGRILVQTPEAAIIAPTKPHRRKNIEMYRLVISYFNQSAFLHHNRFMLDRKMYQEICYL